MAMLAAPAPSRTVRVSRTARCVSWSALMRPAMVAAAVPSWSSCQTGIGRRCWSCSRTPKHFGDAMSSRLIPPKAGASRSTVSMSASGRADPDRDRNGVDPAEPLEQERFALHHGERGLGPDVPEAEDAGAVGHDRDRVPAAGEVERFLRVRLDRPGNGGDPGSVPEREVVEGADRDLRNRFDLARVEPRELHRAAAELVGLVLPSGRGAVLAGAAARFPTRFDGHRNALGHGGD